MSLLISCLQIVYEEILDRSYDRLRPTGGSVECFGMLWVADYADYRADFRADYTLMQREDFMEKTRLKLSYLTTDILEQGRLRGDS